MNPRDTSISHSSRITGFGFILVVIAFSAVTTLAVGKSSVAIRDTVSPAKRNELVLKLRRISGLNKLGFDSDGFLHLGAESSDRGSRGARDLLKSAVSGDDIVVIEDASSRADVAFGRVVLGRWTKANSSLRAFVVLIDFSDFHQLIGDQEARAAFDVGWGFLHELDHVVADSQDSEMEDSLGECESHINSMRHELGLPLRSNYFFTVSSLRTDPNFGTKLVRLAFEQRDTQTDRTRRYWLLWDSTVVGGLIAGKQTASVRTTPERRN